MHMFFFLFYKEGFTSISLYSVVHDYVPILTSQDLNKNMLFFIILI